MASASVVPNTVSKLPLHERRHSRRGSASSLSSLLTLNSLSSSAVGNGQRFGGSTTSLGSLGGGSSNPLQQSLPTPAAATSSSNPISGKPSPGGGKRVLQPHAEVPAESEFPADWIPVPLMPPKTLARPKSMIDELSPKKPTPMEKPGSSVDSK